MHKLTLTALVLALSTSGVAHGLPVIPAQLASSDFSMGFGSTVNSASGWTTTETSGANTSDPSPGVFAFTYAFSQRAGVTYTGAFSSDGPTFPGRVLTNGAVSGGQMSGYSPNFQFTLGGSYITALPAGAVPGSGKLQLTVDSIRIWGAAHTCCSSTNDLFWTETTVLNPGNSPSVALSPFINSGAQVVSASSYDQLTWNPSEFVQTGLSSSRIFVLNTALGFNNGTGFEARVIEGFEIFGSATLLYDIAVPEPATGVLVSVGLVGLAIRRRHRKQIAAA